MLLTPGLCLSISWSTVTFPCKVHNIRKNTLQSTTVPYKFLPAGGAFPFTVGRISHGFSMRPDLCAQDNPTNPKKYLGSFYTDSLVHDPRSLKLLTDVVGKVSHICHLSGLGATNCWVKINFLIHLQKKKRRGLLG